MSKVLSLKALVALSFTQIFAQDQFEKTQEVFAAEDGNIFTDENRAILHVKGKELKYHKISRLEASNASVEGKTSKKESEETPNPSNKDNTGAQQEAPKNESDNEVVQAEKLKELQDLDLTTANYQTLKSLTQFFKLEVADMKQPTLVAALSKLKSKNAQ